MKESIEYVWVAIMETDPIQNNEAEIYVRYLIEEEVTSGWACREQLFVIISWNGNNLYASQFTTNESTHRISLNLQFVFNRTSNLVIP